MTEPSPGRPGTPRWVKVFAIAGGVLLVLVLVALLAGHGPGRHMQHGAPAVSGPQW